MDCDEKLPENIDVVLRRERRLPRSDVLSLHKEDRCTHYSILMVRDFISDGCVWVGDLQ